MSARDSDNSGTRISAIAPGIRARRSHAIFPTVVVCYLPYTTASNVVVVILFSRVNSPFPADDELVSWSLTSPFRDDRSGVVSYPYAVKASDVLTSTLAVFLFSSHPKRERDREVDLNYYA